MNKKHRAINRIESREREREVKIITFNEDAEKRDKTLAYLFLPAIVFSLVVKIKDGCIYIAP